jgi:hypothetical protein
MSELPKVPDLVFPIPQSDTVGDGKKARPWDIFNKNIEKVSSKIQEERMSICLGCPELIKATKQCKKCGCIMELKTKLPHAECPLQKWGKIQLEENPIAYKEEI